MRALCQSLFWVIKTGGWDVSIYQGLESHMFLETWQHLRTHCLISQLETLGKREKSQSSNTHVVAE